MKIKLFTQFYRSENADRTLEILSCLQKNAENNLISQIFVLCQIQEVSFLLNDFSTPSIREKICPISIEERMSFADAITISIMGDNDDIVVIANSDIYFDETLSQVYSIGDNDCYALSRIDIVKGNQIPYFRSDSQDVWIYRLTDENWNKLAMCSSEVEKNYLGIAGCDNAIAHFFSSVVRFNVTNPCLSINCFHLHESNFRTYINLEKIPPPYKLVEPMALTINKKTAK